MDGIDPLAFMRSAAGGLDLIEDPAKLDRLLDDLEYLFEAPDPELRYLAEDLMQRTRVRLGQLRGR